MWYSVGIIWRECPMFHLVPTCRPQLLVPANYDYELEQDAAVNSRAAGALAKVRSGSSALRCFQVWLRWLRLVASLCHSDNGSV